MTFEEIKRRMEIHREWFFMYIDLYEYLTEGNGINFNRVFPSFENYYKHYDSYSHLRKQSSRRYYVLDSDTNKVIPLYTSGKVEPKNWLFYYDYNSLFGNQFNISPKVFNHGVFYKRGILNESYTTK